MLVVNFCDMIICPEQGRKEVYIIIIWTLSENNDSVAISAQFQLLRLLLKLNHEEQYTESVYLMWL